MPDKSIQGRSCGSDTSAFWFTSSHGKLCSLSLACSDTSDQLGAICLPAEHPLSTRTNVPELWAPQRSLFERQRLTKRDFQPKTMRITRVERDYSFPIRGGEL